MDRPTGTVTLLFTDIEGSTRLWEERAVAMRAALARHDALLRHSIEARDGSTFKTGGDAFCPAFHTAPDALSAALEWLERAYMQRDPGVVYVGFDRFLEPLHGDPRWRPFLERLRLG